MNMIFALLGIVIRFLLFFVVVRNIARNKAYGWDRRDYAGMVIVGLVLLWGWFSSYGLMRLLSALFLGGTVVCAVFEGLDNRRAALSSALVFLCLMIGLVLFF